MGVLFCCPSCQYPLNVKSHLAGKAGFCPSCQSRLVIPDQSEMEMSRFEALIRERGQGDLSAEKLKSQVVAERPQNLSGQSASTTISEPTPAAESAPAPLADPVDDRIDAASGTPREQPQFVAATAGTADTADSADAIAAAQPGYDATNEPIREALTSQWYVRPPSGGQFGPADGELMAKWIDEGRVTGDSFVWRDGWEDWRLAADVFPDLADSLSASGVASSSGIEVPGSVRARAAYLKARRRRTIFGVIGLLVGTAVVLALVAILFIVIQKQNQDSSNSNESAVISDIKGEN